MPCPQPFLNCVGCDRSGKRRRADVYIAGALKISRTKAAKLCDVGSVTLDGIKISKNHRMNANDLLEISDNQEAGLHQNEQDSTESVRSATGCFRAA